MSKPALEDIFSFGSVRRNRKSYLIYSLLSLGTFVAVMIPIAVLIHSTSDEGASSAIALLASPFALAWALSAIAVQAQRIRDFGLTGWAVLLLFVPYIGPFLSLVLFFVPGTEGDNRYGGDPRHGG